MESKRNKMKQIRVNLLENRSSMKFEQNITSLAVLCYFSQVKFKYSNNALFILIHRCHPLHQLNNDVAESAKQERQYKVTTKQSMKIPRNIKYRLNARLNVTLVS